MKHLFREPLANVDQSVICQEYGGDSIRTLGHNGIDILVTVSKLRSDGLIKRF